MKTVLLIIVALGLVFAAALRLWRQADHRADRAETDRLLATQPSKPDQFAADMITGLPEPARRYFTYSIADGTPLFTVAHIKMQGRFSLGSKDAPNYMRMKAVQVLAAPIGFVWKMSGGKGLMRMSGSDAGQWTRFWLSGFAPVARFGGNADHARSAFGRYAAESAFWTPAALLPGPNVTWESVDDNTARYTVTHGGLCQSVDIAVDEIGRPLAVQFQRWSNANPEGVYQLQPFGGTLSDFQMVQGFHLPMHIEAGNFFGAEAYFPFFIVDVTELLFPTPAP